MDPSIYSYLFTSQIHLCFSMRSGNGICEFFNMEPIAHVIHIKKSTLIDCEKQIAKKRVSAYILERELGASRLDIRPKDLSHCIDQGWHKDKDFCIAEQLGVALDLKYCYSSLYDFVFKVYASWKVSSRVSPNQIVIYFLYCLWIYEGEIIWKFLLSCLLATADILAVVERRI